MAEPAPAPQEDLEDTVRRSDPDRWLASRFIPAGADRDAVTALYAFDHVLARVPVQVTEPLMGEIRLTWWSEALDEIYAGGAVRSHPVALGLTTAVRGRALERAPLDALVEARFSDIRPEPFADAADAAAYADRTAGALMQAAAQALGGPPGDRGALLAGRAYGLAALAHRRAIGGRTRLAEGIDVSPVVAEALAGADLKALPVAAFPAVSYASLSRRYARGAHLTMLEKQLRLVWATATGRV